MPSVKFLLALLIPLVVAFEDYTPQTYPNGKTSPEECGTLTPSLLCDPSKQLNDGNVTANHAELIQKLNQIVMNTKCLCEDTDRGACIGGVGTTVSLAIVQRMKLDDNEHDRDHRLEAVQKFAEVLRKRQNRDQCDDDVLIVYSVEDNAIWTSTGLVSGRVMKPEVIKEITVNAEKMLKKKKPTRAFLYMLDYYHQLLDGKRVQVSDNNSWFLGLPLWLCILIVVIAALLLITTVLCIAFICIKCFCCKDRRGNYDTVRRM